MIGVAYSVGFIIGPVIGAIFSKMSQSSSGNLYILPALFTMAVTGADIAFLYLFLEETLPKHKRVRHKNMCFYVTLVYNVYLLYFWLARQNQ